MQLFKIIEQGRLLYFNQGEDSISIYENSHYRWLLFDDVLQSLLLKRKPWQLVLPHQYILLLPLVFFRPQKIVEFGLGGGNIKRYITQLNSAIDFCSVELNSQVINCFNEFFNPDNITSNIIHNDAAQALYDKSLRQANWYIYDIYQHDNQSTNAQLLKSKLVANAIDEHSWLSLNLPDPTEPELLYLITQLAPVFDDHQLVFFKVPRFLNVIIHFVPKKHLTNNELTLTDNSYLTSRMQLRGYQYWQQFSIAKKKLPDRHSLT
jgi:spermidine synthase